MSVLPDIATVSSIELATRCDEIDRWVSEAEDLWAMRDLQENLAAAAAAYARVTKKGRGRLAATERRAEARLGDLILAARERGELAGEGNPRTVEGSTVPTLDDLGLARQDAAEYVAMAEHPEAVEEAILGSTDERPATRNKVRDRVRAARRVQSREHPARFSTVIVSAMTELLEPLGVRRILDPFAGTGLVHVVADKLAASSIGIEIEPEWAEQHERTLCADSRTITRSLVGRYDAVVTSPTYGNRMADHHEARDESDRATYRHRLGHDLTPGNSGAMAWGDEYRALHVAVYRRVVRLLDPGGVFVLNVKDHVRDGRRQPVSGWHVSTLLGLGLFYVDDNAVPSRGLGGAGENASAREGVEHVYLLESP